MSSDYSSGMEPQSSSIQTQPIEMKGITHGQAKSESESNVNTIGTQIIEESKSGDINAINMPLDSSADSHEKDPVPTVNLDEYPIDLGLQEKLQKALTISIVAGFLLPLAILAYEVFNGVFSVTGSVTSWSNANADNISYSDMLRCNSESEYPSSISEYHVTAFRIILFAMSMVLASTIAVNAIDRFKRNVGALSRRLILVNNTGWVQIQYLITTVIVLALVLFLSETARPDRIEAECTDDEYGTLNLVADTSKEYGKRSIVIVFFKMVVIGAAMLFIGRLLVRSYSLMNFEDITAYRFEIKGYVMTPVLGVSESLTMLLNSFKKILDYPDSKRIEGTVLGPDMDVEWKWKKMVWEVVEVPRPGPVTVTVTEV
jgi:hypothetical protein